MKIKNYLFGFIAICAVGFSVPAIAIHNFIHSMKDAENITKMAEQGNVEAQFWLGGWHERMLFVYDPELDQGFNKESDYKTAVQWYRKAAEQGHAEAQYWLGFIYDYGEGVPDVPEDGKIAAQWYRKAAEQGHVKAHYSLARMYNNGEGSPEDHKIAAQWFRKSAEQGNIHGQAYLSSMYENGTGVPKDMARAYMWISIMLEEANGDELGTAIDRHYYATRRILGKITDTEYEKVKSLLDTCLKSNYQDC